MDDLERKAFRERRYRQKRKDLGSEHPRCIICGEDDLDMLEGDHVAGRAHDDQVMPLCKNHHAKRTQFQREQPRAGNPSSWLEQLGRWLLSMAEYFEMMIPNLRRFGEWILRLAASGYCDGFELEID